MAGITNRPNGHRWIQFYGPDNRRRTIRLGRIDEKPANEVRRRVEFIQQAKATGTSLDRETAEWVASIGDGLRAKLVAVGLIDKTERPADIGIKQFLDEYIAGRGDLKSRSVNRLEQARRLLIAYFGENAPISSFTVESGEKWRIWLLTEAKVGGRGFADNSARRHCGRARQFFKAAIRQKLISENPFAEVPTAVRGNPKRQHFVTRNDTQAIIDAAPNLAWKTVIALARYGGLRCPSEVFTLAWADIDLAAGKMTIRATKTEHHANGGIRVCPIFPELMPFLRACHDARNPDDRFVITGSLLSAKRTQVGGDSNLRSNLLRIIRKAGLTPWPKLFQNMRSTRQTELIALYPIQDVCNWLGNSRAVALEHYAQVTNEAFRAAVQGPASKPPSNTKADVATGGIELAGVITALFQNATLDRAKVVNLVRSVRSLCDAILAFNEPPAGQSGERHKSP